MIFNITSIGIFSLDIICWFDSLKFSHNNLHWLPYNVCQDIQSASVGHTDNKIDCSFINSCINSYFDTWNKTFTPFKTKSFHCVEFLCKEISEFVWPVKSIIEMNFLFISHPIKLDTFKVNTNPILNFSFGNVHEFDSNFTTISIFVSSNNISQLPILLLCENTAFIWKCNMKFTIQISFSKTILFIIKKSDKRSLCHSKFLFVRLNIFVNCLKF